MNLHRRYTRALTFQNVCTKLSDNTQHITHTQAHTHAHTHTHTHTQSHTNTHRPGSPDSALGGQEEEDPENLSLELIIRTTEQGYSGGRSYIYRTSFHNAIKWEAEIDDAVLKAKCRALKARLLRKFGISIYIHTHIHTYVYPNIYIYTYMRMYIQTYVYIHTYIHTYVYT